MTDDELCTSLSANTIMAILTNHVQRTRLKHHRLTNIVHLTLKMTFAQVAETSVTNNSSFQNYGNPHQDDHTTQTTHCSLLRGCLGSVNLIPSAIFSPVNNGRKSLLISFARSESCRRIKSADR